jgi:N,N'-diacetyllegionaminate synthase
MKTLPPGFCISHRQIGIGQPAFIIAEVGINHGGNEEVAARMIDAAAAAGADAVKLQTVNIHESYRPGTPSYQEFRGKELSLLALRRLIARADDHGIILFSTPGDLSSLDLMCEADMPAVKISSGLMTNLPLIAKAASTGRPLVISTGMGFLEEVVEAVETAREAGAHDIVVLQCTSIYPAPAEKLNLRAMQSLAAATGCLTGYSDHFDGALACVAAVSAGAIMIEKHFTMDRNRIGEDHSISLEPDAFKNMVADIRLVEQMLGSTVKQPSPEEIRQRPALHRRLVVSRDLPAGHRLAPTDLVFMRLQPDEPGLPASQLKEVIGKTIRLALAQYSGLQETDLEDIA